MSTNNIIPFESAMRACPCGRGVADGTDGLCETCRTARADDAFLAAAREIGGWIPTREALPPSFTPVLVTDGDRLLLAEIDTLGNWWLPEFQLKPVGSVTHWMPLPALPNPKSKIENPK